MVGNWLPGPHLSVQVLCATPGPSSELPWRCRLWLQHSHRLLISTLEGPSRPLSFSGLITHPHHGDAASSACATPAILFSTLDAPYVNVKKWMLSIGQKRAPAGSLRSGCRQSAAAAVGGTDPARTCLCKSVRMASHPLRRSKRADSRRDSLVSSSSRRPLAVLAANAAGVVRNCCAVAAARSCTAVSTCTTSTGGR